MRWTGARRLLRAWKGDDAGNIAIISAVFLPVAIGLAALAVDSGSLYLERRESQGLADLAAIQAAGQINQAAELARATLQDNGISDVSVDVDKWEDGEWRTDGGEDATLGHEAALLVEKGRYSPDPDLVPVERFDPAGHPHNAVRVTMRKPGSLYFGKSIMGRPRIEVSGIGHASSQAAFSVGSRLASINDGLLNQLLGQFLGSEISLSVMDYRALVDARVNVLEMFDGLATELDLTAATYDDVLDSEVTIGQIASVIAGMSDVGPRARWAASQIGAQGDVVLPMGSLIDLGDLGRLAIGEGQGVLEAYAGAFDILGAGMAVANGEHQIELDLGIAVPGVAKLTADLAIGEPEQNSPWFSVGEKGDIVRTAQTRLRLIAEIGGKGVLSAVKLRLPVYVEVAYAEARLDDVTCSTGRINSAKVSIDARPGIIDAWIGEIDPDGLASFEGKPGVLPARIVDAPLLKVDGTAHAEMGNLETQEVRFNYQDITRLRVKTVSTRDFSESLIKSLLGDLQLDVRAFGLGFGLPGALGAAVANQLAPLAGVLDDVIYQLLTTLGVRVGEADIRVHGVACQRAVLVQ